MKIEDLQVADAWTAALRRSRSITERADWMEARA
jgi:hypothetical protein